MSPIFSLACFVAAFVMSFAAFRNTIANDAASVTIVAEILSRVDSDGPAAAVDLVAHYDALAAKGQAIDADMARSLVVAARSVGRLGHWKSSVDLLVRARQSMARNSTDGASLHTIDLGIATAANRCGDAALAIAHCGYVIDDPAASDAHRAAAFPMLVTATQAMSTPDITNTNGAIDVLRRAMTTQYRPMMKAPLADAAMSLGIESLRSGNGHDAAEAFQAYQTLLPDGPRRIEAELGDAWATAIDGADASAADKLCRFAESYIDHPDAAHALRAAATCCDKIGETERATAIRNQICVRYPTSEAAAAILHSFAGASDAWPPWVRDGWKMRLNLAVVDVVEPIPALVTVLFNALDAGDDALWQSAKRYLMSSDPRGRQTNDILNQMLLDCHDSTAEHLAVDLIAGVLVDGVLVDGGNSHSHAASEAACRWAGSQQRWTLLSMAADELGPPGGSSSRSVLIDRILAESLMQTNRGAEAMAWWASLIDDQHADDFPTLLRGAETAAAHGTTDDAMRRIEQARAAIGNVPMNRQLVAVLTAELLVRRARFDEARETLDQVVRAPDAVPSLRARAQWWIGETYFLQSRFPDAIDAYRRVDTLEDAGQWAPAALLQAGKAFEKLGRSREAATCYAALLDRFADWPHAGIAQARLATLAPITGPVLR